MNVYYAVQTYRPDVKLRLMYTLLPREGERLVVAASASLVHTDREGWMSMVWRLAEDHELCTWDGKSDDGPQGEINFPLDSYEHVVFLPPADEEVEQVIREWLHPNFTRVVMNHITIDGPWCKRIDWDPSAQFEFEFCR